MVGNNKERDEGEIIYRNIGAIRSDKNETSENIDTKVGEKKLWMCLIGEIRQVCGYE